MSQNDEKGLITRDSINLFQTFLKLCKAGMNTHCFKLQLYKCQLLKKNLIQIKVAHIQIGEKLLFLIHSERAVLFQHYLMISSVKFLWVSALLNVHSGRNLLFNQQVQRKRKQTFFRVVLSKIIYDRVLNEKNNFEIPSFFMFERGKSRVEYLI